MQVNRFKKAKQCQMHKDKYNQGDSMWAMMGECTGGALRLQTGERFSEKRKWHRFNGAVTPHRVEAFRGERLTVVLFTAKESVRELDCRWPRGWL